jgi:hypothetical protein
MGIVSYIHIRRQSQMLIKQPKVTRNWEDFGRADSIPYTTSAFLLAYSVNKNQNDIENYGPRNLKYSKYTNECKAVDILWKRKSWVRVNKKGNGVIYKEFLGIWNISLALMVYLLQTRNSVNRYEASFASK